MARTGHWFDHGINQALGDILNPLSAEFRAKQHGELVTANTSYEVSRLAYGREPPSGFDQALIANGMPVSIINVLKAIEIDEHEDASSAPPELAIFRQSGFKLTPVGKACHDVVPREILDLFDAPLFIGDVLLDAEKTNRFAGSPPVDGGRNPDPTGSEAGNPDFGI